MIIIINVLNYKKEIRELNNDNNNHDEYIFYYDETNNYKKIKIREDGLNDNKAFYKNYVLGGFCYLKENTSMINILELFKNELKKYSNGELKAVKLFKDCKTFLECLNKQQVGIILKWINKNGFIHYSSMNCLYFSIIDLVDSFFTDEPENLMPKQVIDIVKNQLYHLIFEYKEQFIDLANYIDYPNIKPENIKVLCDWLIALIDEININNQFNLELARQIIKSKRKSNSLLFLQDNEDKTIVENFYGLRQQKCIVFDKSYHIFDQEPTDEELMEQNQMTLDNKTIFKNYEFKDSKSERLIQISDVIVSLVGKYLDFIDNTKVKDIKKNIENLNPTQKKNLKLLIELIDKSYKQDGFLIGSINSMDINYYRNDIKDFIYNII